MNESRSVIVPFAGAKHTPTKAEVRAISRVREIAQTAKDQQRKSS